MSEIMSCEKMLVRILNDSTSKFVRTGSPNIICTRLPHHWRCNKQLPSVFKVVSLCEVANGTRVSVSAGNEDNQRARLRNCVAGMLNNVATFDDFRFVGRSGRGKSFHVVITIHSKPMQVAIYKNAIKITIDGPRVPRNKFNMKRTLSESSSLNSQVATSSPPFYANNSALSPTPLPLNPLPIQTMNAQTTEVNHVRPDVDSDQMDEGQSLYYADRRARTTSCSSSSATDPMHDGGQGLNSLESFSADDIQQDRHSSFHELGTSKNLETWALVLDPSELSGVKTCLLLPITLPAFLTTLSPNRPLGAL